MRRAITVSFLLHAAVAGLLACYLWASGRGSGQVAELPTDIDIMRIGEKALAPLAGAHTTPARPAKAAAVGVPPKSAQDTPLVATSAPAAQTAQATPVSAPAKLRLSVDGSELVLTRAQYELWVRRHNTPPSYPVKANQSREQGRVLVRVVIDRGGALQSARVETSSGHELLDREALEIVKSWTFPPYQGADETLELRLPFKFELYD